MNQKLFSFLVLLFFASSTLLAQNSYETEIENWKQKRIDYLKSEEGWLNLIGLFWLHQGKNTFGSGNNVEIKFPTNSIPENAGYFELNGTTVTLFANELTDIKINNTSLKRAILFSADTVNTFATYGSLKWNIIKREDKIGVRLRDLQSPLAKSFTGINRFATDSLWRIKAYLKKPQINSNIFITNILGQTNAEASAGKLIFNFANKEYVLDALEEDNQLFILFGDATSGKETYPTGRFLYANFPDTNGYTIIDFNKAFNPPCAFTNYATCPLPPKQNILPFAVTAGEKTYGHH